MPPAITSGTVAVAMLGARMHYAVPQILNDLGLLERLFTDIYFGNKPTLAALVSRLPRRLQGADLRRLSDRNKQSIPAERVTSFDMFGLSYAMARRRVRNNDELAHVFGRYGAMFNRKVVRHGFGRASALWGFNTASIEMFRAARDQGLSRILEQTILPSELEHRLMQEQIDAWRGWQPGLDIGAAVLKSREQAEWELADRIVVGSAFVAEGLAACGVSGDKIAVIPYGVDPERFSPAGDRDSRGRPLRILFVGEIGLRKGVPYLLEALRRIGPGVVEARLAGHVALDPARLGPYADVADVLGSVPRAAMPDLLRWADVLVLPSIVEGSATVTYEALMSGLAVITTPNAGSIVEDGMNGRIVGVRDSVALAEAILEYCDDRDLLNRHRAAARTAKQKASISRYSDDLARFMEGSRGP